MRFFFLRVIMCWHTLHSFPNLYYEASCGSGGVWSEPADWATCQQAVTCDHPPVPPAGSHWERVDPGATVYEYQNVYYRCESGYELSVPPGEEWPSDHDGVQQKLECKGDGHIKDDGSQPYHTSGEWPNCAPVSKRKKRHFDDDDDDVVEEEEEGGELKVRAKRATFTGLHEDVDYTTKTLVEVQFMYETAIQAEISAEYAVNSLSDPAYARGLVDKFHLDLNAMMPADRRLREGMEFLDDFDPMCQQPTSADMKGVCQSFSSCEQPTKLYNILGPVLSLDINPFLLFLATSDKPVCDKTKIGAQWLVELGFTYEQQWPRWSDHTAVDFHTPVGAEVYFFCSDDRKRPRKDNWDDDDSDGVIYAYCTPTGDFSITMNPPEWDRCKIKCPAAKPEPPLPTDPERQLFPYDSDQKWQRTHWEDEEIKYGCNPEFVIDNNVEGIKSVNYACNEEGEYAVPAGDRDDPWPVCTNKPYDPGECHSTVESSNVVLVLLCTYGIYSYVGVHSHPGRCRPDEAQV